MKKLLEYLKIYIFFIYEEFIYSDFIGINKIGKFLIKPFYYISFLYWYILSIIFFPFFLFMLIYHDKIEKIKDISILILSELFN